MLRLVDRIKPILKLMKKIEKFAWNTTCEEAFFLVRNALATPPFSTNRAWRNLY